MRRSHCTHYLTCSHPDVNTTAVGEEAFLGRRRWRSALTDVLLAGALHITQPMSCVDAKTHYNANSVNSANSWPSQA